MSHNNQLSRAISILCEKLEKAVEAKDELENNKRKINDALSEIDDYISVMSSLIDSLKGDLPRISISLYFSDVDLDV